MVVNEFKKGDRVEYPMTEPLVGIVGVLEIYNGFAYVHIQRKSSEISVIRSLESRVNLVSRRQVLVR